MNRAGTRMILALMAAASLINRPAVAADPSYDRKEDVIYGRKFGMALTMDVFTPRKDAKGIGVILVVSGGFFSSHEAIQPVFVRPLTDRGYTVFAVVHGSQPRFTVPEIVEDMNRAVRFIRHHAKDYGIDPARIGVCGASAGGHLSLMLGTAGSPGNPDAKDPVDRESSRVQAVACFFPPTDLLNYGQPGHRLIHAIDHGRPYRPAYDYRELDKETNLWVTITDPDKLEQIAREISPVYHVTPDDPAHPHHPRRHGSDRPPPAIRADRREAEERRRRNAGSSSRKAQAMAGSRSARMRPFFSTGSIST